MSHVKHPAEPVMRCVKNTQTVFMMQSRTITRLPHGGGAEQSEAERGERRRRRTPSQSADADSSPLGGAEALAFPRCGAGVNPKAHSVRFEDPAAVSAARLTDEG